MFFVDSGGGLAGIRGHRSLFGKLVEEPTASVELGGMVVGSSHMYSRRAAWIIFLSFVFFSISEQMWHPFTRMLRASSKNVVTNRRRRGRVRRRSRDRRLYLFTFNVIVTFSSRLVRVTASSYHRSRCEALIVDKR